MRYYFVVDTDDTLKCYPSQRAADTSAPVRRENTQTHTTLFDHTWRSCSVSIIQFAIHLNSFVSIVWNRAL